MSTKDTLKNIVERRYLKNDQDLNKNMELTNLGSTVYFPHIVNNKNYLIKVNFFIEITDNKIVESNTVAKIDGIVELDQKVIALRHPLDQENLKFYYEKGKKIGAKDGE